MKTDFAEKQSWPGDLGPIMRELLTRWHRPPRQPLVETMEAWRYLAAQPIIRPPKPDAPKES